MNQPHRDSALNQQPLFRTYEPALTRACYAIVRSGDFRRFSFSIPLRQSVQPIWIYSTLQWVALPSRPILQLKWNRFLQGWFLLMVRPGCTPGFAIKQSTYWQNNLKDFNLETQINNNIRTSVRKECSLQEPSDGLLRSKIGITSPITLELYSTQSYCQLIVSITK